MLRSMNAEPDVAGYSREQAGPKIEISGPWVERSEEVLTPLSMQLLASLHRRFNPRPLEVLAAPQRRQAELGAGGPPRFLHAPTPPAPGEEAPRAWDQKSTP